TNNLSDGNVINLGNLPSLLFTHNVLLSGTVSLYPLGNWFPPGTTPVVNAYYGGADYHLVSGSPYRNAGTDGKDVGADVDAVNAATANAITGTTSGTPPPPPPPPPPAATVVVTPSTQDFGSVTVGGSVDRSFTATNSGGTTASGASATSAPFT